MFMHQMPGYGEPTLACWPAIQFQTGKWKLQEYKLKRDGSLLWRDAFEEHEGHARAVWYDSYEHARAEAEARNPALLKAIRNLAIDEEVQTSLQLKARKAIYVKMRLHDEEILMRQEAARRTQGLAVPDINQLVLSAEGENYRSSLHVELSRAPFLPLVIVSDQHRRVLFYKNSKQEFAWKGPLSLTQKKFHYAERAYIAVPFGMSPTHHWGKAKAQIRQMLLPRANQLLELASVKRILADLEREGIKVAVVGSYAFWYETNGEIGWSVKEISSEGKGSEETVWREGTIHSRNHGRIIVLPYVKENGELVKGHTKNSPNDGPAKPRHPSQYLDLPFKTLSGDLMRGLFGELPYE
nr:hypothetical protein [uncultured Achromobacter sp.]